MPPNEGTSPPPPQAYYNPNTKQLEVPTAESRALPHDVSSWSRKNIEPIAIESQAELESARREQLEARGQTIPLDEIPEDLLTPNELERKWEGGVTQTPPPPQQPVSLRPGMAPVAMAPNPNAPPPQPQQEGINQAEFQDRLERYKASRTEQLEAKLRQEAAERDAALERQRQREMAAFQADKAEVARLSRPENLFAQPSTGQKILNAIAAGLGAWGATMGRTPNYALDIIQKRMDDDAKARQLALNTAIKRAQMSGESVDKLIKMQADGDRRNKEARIEQMHWIDANVAKMQARWPAKAQALEQVRADMQAKSAQDTRDFFAQYGGGTRSGTHYGLAVTQQVGSTSNQKPQPVSNVSESETRAAMYAMRMKRGIEQIDKNPPLTAEDFRNLSNNVLDIKAQAENATKGILSPSLRRKALRAAGLGPESLTTGIKGAGKKAAAIGWLEGAGLIIRYESGAAINIEENMMANLKKIPQGDEATPEGIKMKRDGMEYEADLMMKSAGPAAHYRYLGYYPEGYDEYGRPLVGNKSETTESGELPGGARVPPEGQTPAQVRYTRETKAQLEADKRASGAAPGAGEKPITSRQMGKALKKMPSNIKEGVRDAMKVPKGSPKYDMAQKYLREKYEEYAP